MAQTAGENSFRLDELPPLSNHARKNLNGRLDGETMVCKMDKDSSGATLAELFWNLESSREQKNYDQTSLSMRLEGLE